MVLVCTDVKDLVSHSIDIQLYIKQGGKFGFLKTMLYFCVETGHKKVVFRCHIFK